jgi:hypothetical protein
MPNALEAELYTRKKSVYQSRARIVANSELSVGIKL